MTDEPRDDLDRALSAGLADLADTGGDADAVLASMQPRLRRARTRHRVMRTSAVALALLACAGVAGALSGTVEKQKVSVSHPSSHDRDDTHGSTTTVQPTPSTTVSNPVLPDGSGGAVSPPNTLVPGAVPIPSQPGSNDGPGGGSNDGTGSGNEGPPSPTTTLPPEEHTYVAPGGSVTIRYANGEIHIVSVTPTAGCSVERHDDGPDRVEVRFQNCAQESRIRVDLQDGQLVQEID